jgi:hypothetical protein
VAALSYSLYRADKMVMHIDGLIVGTDSRQSGMGFLVQFGTSLVTAGALWLVIERPFLQMRNSKLSRLGSWMTQSNEIG